MTQEEIDKVEVWTEGHKQKEGKEPNPGVVEALVRTQLLYMLFLCFLI